MDSRLLDRRPRLVLDPARAFEIARELGEEVVRSYMLAHGCGRIEAMRAIHAAGQVGRTESAVMRGGR